MAKQSSREKFESAVRDYQAGIDGVNVANSGRALEGGYQTMIAYGGLQEAVRYVLGRDDSVQRLNAAAEALGVGARGRSRKKGPEKGKKYGPRLISRSEGVTQWMESDREVLGADRVSSEAAYQQRVLYAIKTGELEEYEGDTPKRGKISSAQLKMVIKKGQKKRG